MGSHSETESDKSRGLAKNKSLWFSENPGKKWTEVFILCYSPVWILFDLGIVVPFQLYERFSELEYLLLGIGTAFPCFLLPLFIVGKADRHRPILERHWVKMNIWIAVVSFVGNYFWTHYFYNLLGASYTFPSWRLNNVPIPLYLMTHAYFCFYHVLSSLFLRRLRHSLSLSVTSPIVRTAVQVVWVVLFSYFTAFMETLTIANFPYYTFVDKASMYKYGSLFYAIYFFVTFPMFIRLDESPGVQWTLGRTVVDALGGCMLVTILLDLWRIMIGSIVTIPGLPTYQECLAYGVPWLK